MRQQNEIKLNNVEEIFTKSGKNNEKVKTNKFFALLAFLFKNYYRTNSENKVLNNIKSEEKPIEKEIIPLTDIQTKADQFIVIEEYGVVKNMVKNGYELLPSQNKAIENYLGKMLIKYESISESHKEIESWLELGFNIDKEYIGLYLTRLINHLNKAVEDNPIVHKFYSKYPISFFYNDLGNMMNKLEDGTKIEYPLLTAQIKNTTKENKFFKTIFTSLMDFNSSNTSYHRRGATRNALLLIEMLQDERKTLLAKELNFDEFLQLFLDFQKTDFARHSNVAVLELKKELQNFLNENYKNNLTEVINSVKEEYSDKYIEKIVINNIQEETKHITVNNLPEEAKLVLNDIRILYTKIQKSEIKPTETETFTINNLFNKTVPEILRKYLTIDEQYKNTLTNASGKNPQELMIDSLKNIQTNFEEVWENINNQAVSSLSATNKYTKNFKR